MLATKALPTTKRLHKAATMLAERYETVVAEDLNVAGMTRNRRLARAVGDQGFGMLRRMLACEEAKRLRSGGRTRPGRARRAETGTGTPPGGKTGTAAPQGTAAA